MDKRLKVISSQNENTPSSSSAGVNRDAHKLEAKARLDRLWLIDPEKFNPERDAMQRQLTKLAFHLAQSKLNLTSKQVVDLGCGSGTFSRKLRDAGAIVDAVDLSGNALKRMLEHDMTHITPRQEYVPYTKLDDNRYDLVVSLGLIGSLPQKEHRLYFSELARLVKADGFVLCGTPIDIDTIGALQIFGSLAETEFAIDTWDFSYHVFTIRISDFLSAPRRFAKAWKETAYRNEQLDKRSGLTKKWFQMNSSRFIGPFWQVMQIFTSPISNFFDQSPKILKFLEKLCHNFWGEAGISHVHFIGQRRPFIPPTPEELRSEEPKHKRQVWE